MPIRIAFVAPWATPQALLNDFKRFTPKQDGRWGAIQGIANVKRADYVIVMDNGRPNLVRTLDRKRIVYLQREPSCIKKVHWPDAHQFHVNGTFQNLIKAATPWILKPYATLKHFTYQPRKHPLVAICSGKHMVPAHRQRLVLLKHLAKHLGASQLHVYGRGLKAADFHGCYRGAIVGKCKFDTLKRYQYALALENAQEKNYVTEKLYDCFLTLTVPIYWGAPNIETYVLPDALVCLPSLTHLDTNTTLIARTLQHAPTERTIAALQNARDRTLDAYMIWPQLESLVSPRQPRSA